MKLYISDLDGTLLNNDKEISEYTKDTINGLAAKGVYFSVATARSAASAIKILSGVNINIPVVLMNGAAIYDIQKGKYIKTEAIPERTACTVVAILKEHDITGFMYAIPEDRLVTYYESLNTKALHDFHCERVIKYAKKFEQTDSFLDKISSNNIVYFTLIDEYDRLSKVLNALKRVPHIDAVLYRDIYAENLWYLEIHSKNASKYNAVKYLREYCRFDRIIGFGDNLNDIPFLEACDEFYAVSNAVEQLKQKANGVIGSHDSDGVARFIIHIETSQ
ncbi:MAG: HAD family hydrolase [Bacillota bacterium]